MADVGKVIQLFSSQNNKVGKRDQEVLTLDAKGIIGDKYYNSDIKRSVLITSNESYLLASSHQIEMAQGTLGENILIDYNPYHLVSGDQLTIGEVILEISQNCTMCDHLSQIDTKLPTLLKNDRGIFAKVIKSGMIQKGDAVGLITHK